MKIFDIFISYRRQGGYDTAKQDVYKRQLMFSPVGMSRGIGRNMTEFVCDDWLVFLGNTV